MSGRRFFASTVRVENPVEFVSIWNTENISTGSSNSDQISLPLRSNGTYDFTVDWGDGSSDNITSWDQAEKTHTYASAGIYEIKITGVINGWRFFNTFSDSLDGLKILEITDWGSLNLGNEILYFYGCSNLTSVAGNLNSPSTVDFSYLFYNCSLTFLPTGILNNQVNATNFERAFTNNSIISVPPDLFNFCPNVTSFHVAFTNNTINTEDYSNLLINIEATNANSNVPFHGGNSKYNAAGETARNALIARGWTITDGGLEA